MSKTVVLVGSLDTKGEEFAFVKTLIEGLGLKTFVVDFGVMGDPALKPDIRRDQVAKAAGGDLTYLQSGEHKDQAMQTMSEGLAIISSSTMTANWTVSLGWEEAGVHPSPPLQCAACRLEFQK